MNYLDHVAAATHFVGRAESMCDTDDATAEDISAVAAVAQVHATLALVALRTAS